MLKCTEGENVLSPENILGTQYISSCSRWFVYLSNKETKAIALAADTITISDKSYKLDDYAQYAKLKNNRHTFF